MQQTVDAEESSAVGSGTPWQGRAWLQLWRHVASLEIGYPRAVAKMSAAPPAAVETPVQFFRRPEMH